MHRASCTAAPHALPRHGERGVGHYFSRAISWASRPTGSSSLCRSVTSLIPWFIVGIPLLWLLARRTRSVRGRQALFLAASYGFYLTFGWRFFVILLASSIFNFYWGALLRRRPTSTLVLVGVVLNVALLSVFKYLPAFAIEFGGGSGFAGRVAQLALPIGISFWTFQGLSYLFDQYRGAELDPTLLEFLLYMGFAPTVMSGPICRLPELLPQLRADARGSWDTVTAGVRSIWIGMLMIALARLIGGGLTGNGVNSGFDRPGAPLSGADVWLLLVGYGFQLFFDFAGYSRIVIGIARLFGIVLPENFRRPFLAATPSVFWTRWHMTLSFWIRDYVFMPLATVRRDLWWRNAMVVVPMVVFGLWHKASVLFLLWGLYQGLLLLGHRLFQQWQRRSGVSSAGPLGTAVSGVLTFAAITLGWTLFRASDWHQAAGLLRSALLPFSSQPAVLPRSLYVIVLGVAAIYLVLEGLRERSESGRTILAMMPVELRFACYGAIFYFALFRSSEPQSFIYVQF